FRFGRRLLGMISVAAKNWSDWERLVLNIRWAYVILFLALNFVYVNATSTMHNSTVNTLRQIDGALEQYQLENHRLPTTAEGLSPVKEFIKEQTVPFDAWEHQFVYLILALTKRMASTFILWERMAFPE